MILKTCSEQQDDWDETLKKSYFRTARWSIVLRKRCLLRSCLVGFRCQKIITDDDSHFENTVSKLKELRHAIEKDVKENIAKSQDKQILRLLMRKTNEISKNGIKGGDEVLLFNSRKANKKGSKLEKTWLGPYVVTTVTSKGVATMETKDGKPLRTKHNIKNLKKYKTRERDGDLNNHYV